MTPARFGDPNEPWSARSGTRAGRRPVGEVDREELEEREAHGGAQHPAGGDGPGPVAVGQDARGRPGDEEPQGQGQHGDAGPQRRYAEGVAVQGSQIP